MLTTNDISRLESLAAMLEPLAKIAPLLKQIQSAEQAVRDCEAKSIKITAENTDTMQASARIRDEIAAAQAALRKATADAEVSRAKMLDDADARAKSLIVNAQAAAKEILLRAHDEADEAKRRAATIDQTIADKTAESERLDEKVAKAKAYLKRIAVE